MQASTSTSHLAEGQSPILTTPISERSTGRTETLFTPPTGGILTFEQWRKNTNDITARVEPKTETVWSLRNILSSPLLTLTSPVNNAT